MIEQLRRLVLGLGFAGYTACSSGGGHTPPQPPSPPPSTDPSPVCEVGATCGCWHHPPDQGWQQLPPCTPEAPPPTPPNPPPVPPTTGCVLGTPGPQMDAPVTSLGPRVNAVLSRLSGCSVGSRCILTVTGQQWQAHVEQALRGEGLCSGQHEPRTDEIAVSTHAGGIMEAYKIFGGDDSDGPLPPGGVQRTVVWFPGGARVAYLPPGGVLTPTPPTPTPPPPTPPAVAACPIAPCPIRMWTQANLPDGWGPNEIGMPAFTMNSGQQGERGDSTPVVKRQEPFCAAIGMSPYADGQLRAACPMRPDGHADREVIERWILFGGPKRDSRNGQDCTPPGAPNPFAYRAGTGNCRMCSSNAVWAAMPDRRDCTDWR